MCRCRDCQRKILLMGGEEIVCSLGIVFSDMDSLDNGCMDFREGVDFEQCDNEVFMQVR